MSSHRQRARRRVEREEARAQIHDAAVNLLRTNRYRDLTVDALMAETDLARTAFYRFYDDIASLTVEVLSSVGHDLYAVVETWGRAGEEDFATAAREGLTNIVAFFADNGPLVQAMVDAAATDEYVDQAYRAFLDTYDRLIIRGFDGMVERGELTPCDTEALARALNLMGERYLLDCFGHEPLADRQTAIDTLELIWVRTVGVDAAGSRSQPRATGSDRAADA